MELALTGEIRFDERRVTHLAPSTEARVRWASGDGTPRTWRPLAPGRL